MNRIRPVSDTHLDVCVAITGIAWPDGGTEDKPVGLVYISCYMKDKVTVRKFQFKGNQMCIRDRCREVQGLSCHDPGRDPAVQSRHEPPSWNRENVRALAGRSAWPERVRGIQSLSLIHILSFTALGRGLASFGRKASPLPNGGAW